MGTEAQRRVLVDDHRAPDRAALTITPGEVVAVGEWDSKWPASVFVTTDGGSGWVPGRYLEITGSSATVVTGYDTTELTVAAGTAVDVLVNDDESGWSCCTTNGIEGWVPNRVLSAGQF